jgi:hypothetical protein
MYSDKLKEYLVSNPERKVVYMNDKGGWLLHQRVEFPNEVSVKKSLVKTTQRKGKKPLKKNRKRIKLQTPSKK